MNAAGRNASDWLGGSGAPSGKKSGPIDGKRRPFCQECEIALSKADQSLKAAGRSPARLREGRICTRKPEIPVARKQPQACFCLQGSMRKTDHDQSCLSTDRKAVADGRNTLELRLPGARGAGSDEWLRAIPGFRTRRRGQAFRHNDKFHRSGSKLERRSATLMQVQPCSSIIQRLDTHTVWNAKALNRSVATGELASTPNRNSGSSRRYVPLRRAARGCTAQIRA